MRDLEAETQRAAETMRREAARMAAETTEQRLRCQSMRTSNEEQRLRLARRFPGRFVERA